MIDPLYIYIAQTDSQEAAGLTMIVSMLLVFFASCWLVRLALDNIFLLNLGGSFNWIENDNSSLLSHFQLFSSSVYTKWSIVLHKRFTLF